MPVSNFIPPENFISSEAYYDTSGFKRYWVSCRCTLCGDVYSGNRQQVTRRKTTFCSACEHKHHHTLEVRKKLSDSVAGGIPQWIVDPATGCWIWMRAMHGNGYGCLWADGRLQNAHRVIYEQHKGPIPKGLDLDHLCRVRICVNPDHLEPVTRAENLRRGREARRQEKELVR